MNCSDLAVYTKLFALVENDGLIIENKELIFSYCHFFLVLCTTYTFKLGACFPLLCAMRGGLGECMFVYTCKCTHTHVHVYTETRLTQEGFPECSTS